MNPLSRYLSLAARYTASPAALAVKIAGGIPSTYYELNHPWITIQPIDLIVDVGANTGQFAKTARRLFPRASIHSLEPIPGCFEACRSAFASDPNFRISNVAAADRKGLADFSVSADSGASSILPMGRLQKALFPHSTRITKIQVETDTLDSILSIHPSSSRIFLKIDVQGFELSVLRGAQQTLQRCSIVLVETSFQAFYEGQALFAEVYSHLAAHGLALTHAFNFMRTPEGRPVQGDFIFSRV